MVKLIPMNQTEFDKYHQTLIPIKEEKFKNILPKGLNTPNNFFFSVVDEDSEEKVGLLWMNIREGWKEQLVFVSDIRIYEAYQRQGYGMQTFKAMEDKVRELGLNKISLHAFSHNHPAIKMYEKLDYEVTSLYMTKILDS